MEISVDYRICCQRVTVYRKTSEGIVRQELPGCFLQWKEEVSYDLMGRQKERKFLLIQPGTEQLVFAGDRIFEGIGPMVTPQMWDTFLPELVPGLGEAAYATAYHWQGNFCHTEAGRK